MAIIEERSRSLVAESKSQENGDAQLILATKLRVGTPYVLLLEFSEQPGTLDGAAAEACVNFYMSMKTWDSNHVCSSAINQPETDTIVATSDSPF